MDRRENMDRIESREGDSRLIAIREIFRLAREDRARGVRYWFDPLLADDLRELAREAFAGTAALVASARSQVASTGQPGASARAPVSSADAPLAPARRPVAPVHRPLAAAHSGVASSIGMEAADTGGASTGPPPAADTGSLAPGSMIFARSPAGASERTARTANAPEWGPPPEAAGRDPDWQKQLADLGRVASVCTACDLCRTRHTVVFGTGSARVPLVFVGEAPGADEDAQGIPFVGRAGQLLTRIIAAIGLRREDVYICNVLKCRPPGNRNPAPDEIAHCWPYLERQLEILKPKVICTLGLFATQALLESTAPIGRLRGQVTTHRGYRILPTYHPAALLRNPALKATVWEDVQLLRRILDE